MKTLKFNFFMTIVLSVVMLVMSNQTFAQRQYQGMNKGMQNCYLQNSIPDLTQEQQTKLTELRTAHMKEMMQLRNQLQEKKAHLNTLRTSDKPNMTEIDKIIDEIGTLKIKMMKQRERFFQSVRKELTDDQRVYFDMHKQGKCSGKGYKQGKNCKNYGMR
jgi:Spy/CpxP family protein refolding chaperone